MNSTAHKTNFSYVVKDLNKQIYELTIETDLLTDKLTQLTDSKKQKLEILKMLGEKYSSEK